MTLVLTMAAQLLLATPSLPEGDEPTLQAALDSSNKDLWWDAIHSEYNSLLANGTWEEVPVTEQGTNLLPCKWVLKVKRDAMGNVERFKARLVVCGNFQRPGVDYEEVFAPTSRYSTVRTFLAVVAEADLEMCQLDVETAFLNGEIKEEVYMKPPKLFDNVPGVAYRMVKSLYGLRQAPRAWRIKLEEALTELGFHECAGDPGLFSKDTPMGRQFILTFVDDLLMAAGTTRN
jgi:hypothetical protein